MQATLSFRFPTRKQQQHKSVEVCLLFELPEQRPFAAANFFFMCTGELPSDDMLSTLGISRSQIPQWSVDELRSAGLRPFAESAVVRIEKNVMVEIGSSTSTSIFGSFIKDEPLGTLISPPAAWQQLRAGTILMGNLGMPNSNGSRYYILLQDIISSERQKELGVYQPLGIVTNGLDVLREACATVSLQPRTLVPLQPVKLWASKMHYNCHALLERGPGGATRQGVEARVAVRRLAGRVRPRDEDTEEEKEDDNDGDGNAVTSRYASSTAGRCFFDLSQKYAKRPGDDDNSMPAAKRLRHEPPVEQGKKDGGEPFDFFSAQESLFLKDIENIAEVQTVRGCHRTKKGRSGHRPNQLIVPGKGKHTAATTPSTKAKKVLRRRY